MFICFEGIAGSGKTTQTKLLADYLKNIKSKDIFVSAVYERGRRKAISGFMNLLGIKADQNAVMFLFQALHAIQHHEVNEALMSGKIVIADRWRYYFFSHHLQQNPFNGDTKLMNKLDLLAHRTLEPDIYFLLKVPPLIAYERYLKREHAISGGGLDLMDGKYFKSVSGYYEQLAHDKGWNVIDGMQSQDKISKEIHCIIDKKL